MIHINPSNHKSFQVEKGKQTLEASQNIQLCYLPRNSRIYDTLKTINFHINMLKKEETFPS